MSPPAPWSESLAPRLVEVTRFVRRTVREEYESLPAGATQVILSEQHK